MLLKRQRRVRPAFRPTRVEFLEDRKLLSGNVTALLNPATGALVITGDLGNNRITLAPSPIAGDIRVSGDIVLAPPPIGFDVTTVNGVGFTDFVGSAITSINITMLNGVQSPSGPPNHSITIKNIDVSDVPNLTANFGLSITGGTANDTINVTNLTTSGQVTVSENSSAADSDNVSFTNINAGLVQVTTGVGADTLSLNGGKVGNMILNTGGGAGLDTVTINNFPKVGGVSGIGLLSLSAPSTGNNVLTVENSALTTASVTADGGNNTIALSGLTILNGATVSAGGGNDAITVSNTTAGAGLSVTADGGNNTLGVTGTTSRSLTLSTGTGANAVTVSNDNQTGTTGTTFSLTTGGPGAGTPQIITISNDTLAGGNANVSAGDGPVYGFPPPPTGGSVLPLSQTSQFAASNFTGIGAATIGLGTNFRNVTIGSDTGANVVSAASLTVTVGINSNVVLLNTKVAGAESITVGDMQNFGTTLLPANSFILNGTAGTLALSVGANATTFQQNAVVTGTETVSVGANAGAVTILRPTAGNSTITIGVNASGPISITGTDTGDTGPWNEVIMIGTAAPGAGGVSIGGAISGNQTVTVGGGFSGVTVSTLVGGTQTVTVGSSSGTVTISGSAASGTYTIGDNTTLDFSATSPGAVSITGTNGDTITVTSTSLGSLSVNTPGTTGNNTITVQGPLNVTNGGVTINGGTGATVLVDSVTATNDPSGNGVVVTTGGGAISVQVTNTTATALTINNGNGNTFFYLNNDALGLGSVTPANMGLTLNSGNGNNTLLMTGLTVLNGLEIGFGSGVNLVGAENVNADFGFINGGSGTSNVYYDFGGNSGYFVFNFVGY